MQYHYDSQLFPSLKVECQYFAKFGTKLGLIGYNKIHTLVFVHIWICN